ncbi:hypothetical protein [Actinomadura rugatobispora]|uniref:DUF305 domain-containing protein n=1 Tax=Actinomadura rugatobispora TaxID=1994 RepID=A0ABW1AJ77_9ACTN|nr:hypothetical protein GCM10010200_029980 [Actinomadura rugatobispora]
MQPAPIRDGARRVPEPVPHARVLLRGAARVAVVAGLAFAGWYLLSALAGSPASATADPADPGGAAGRLGAALTASADRASGDVLAHTTEHATEHATGRLLGRPSSAVTRLVDEVSDRSGLHELRPAGAALIGSAGLRDDQRAVDRLLSPLTEQPPALGTLPGTGRATALQAAHDDAGAQASPAGARGGFSAAAPGVGSGASLKTGCGSCARAGQGPSAPQPLMPPGQGDASAAFLHTMYGPGPMTGTLSSPIDATPATVDVRALPAAAMQDKSAPARPMVVPD